MDLTSNIVASRLDAQQRYMAVIADNLANANTPGYKAERMQFSDWLSRQTGSATPPGGATLQYTQDRATWRDHLAGTLSHTGNPFDIALAGDGYLTVATPRGPRLTRDGRFGLQADGTVANAAGDALLDTTGQKIQMTPTDTVITLAGDGTFSSENGQLAKVGVVRPTDPAQLVSEGATLFGVNGTTTPVPTPNLVQGAMEDSNVQPVLEMTRMMNGLRQFQMVSSFMQAESDRQQAAIDKLLPASL
jgi:flagellar basal-body rod protein FlgF